MNRPGGEVVIEAARFYANPLEEKSWINQGYVLKTTDHQATFDLNFQNKGNFLIQDGEVVLDKSSQHLVNSRLEVGKDAVLTLADSDHQFQEGAVLENQGRLSGGDEASIWGNGVVKNAGILDPGGDEDLKIGTLAISNYIQTSETAQISIDIRSQTNFDQLNFGSVAVLPDSHLSVNLQNGFKPKVGDRFEIITFEEETNLDKLNITGGDLGGGLKLIPEISANGLTLGLLLTFGDQLRFFG